MSQWPDLAGPCRYSIVRGSVVVGVEEFLEPLDELEVILETTLDQLVNWNNLEEKMVENNWLYFKLKYNFKGASSPRMSDLHLCRFMFLELFN